jgi:hypothetical protein
MLLMSAVLIFVEEQKKKRDVVSQRAWQRLVCKGTDRAILGSVMVRFHSTCCSCGQVYATLARKHRNYIVVWHVQTLEHQY